MTNKTKNILVVRVPGVNGLGNTGGAAEAAEKIAEALGVKTKEIELTRDNVEEQEKETYEGAKEYLNKKEKVVFLGGDHSISYNTCRAFEEIYSKENCFLIVFDAHVDLMPSMMEPTHEEWLRALIDNGFWRAENIVIVGARDIDEIEREFIEERGIAVIGVDDFVKREKEIIEELKNKLNGKELYVSFDIDVYDKEIIEATGYPVAQGFGKDALDNILEQLSRLKELKAFDFVELHYGKKGFERGLEISKNVLGRFIN